MSHPPLLQSLYVVMILAVANIGLKGGALGTVPQGGILVVAVALVGTGVMLSSFVAARKAPPSEDAPRVADDDFDLTA